MTRKTTWAICMLGLLCAWSTVSGCHEHKTRVIQRSETIQESEAQMVAPGKEKVE